MYLDERKHPGGRPKKYDKQVIEKIKNSFEQYIAMTEIPIVKEFCYKNNILSERLYEMPQLSDCIKKCIDKKESILESKGLHNQINPAMAIFSLKQLGWSDRQELEHSGILQLVTGVDRGVREKKQKKALKKP